jgi:hypothetical protein
MGIVMANTSISIDGFVAGPNHEMDLDLRSRLPTQSADPARGRSPWWAVRCSFFAIAFAIRREQ